MLNEPGLNERSSSGGASGAASQALRTCDGSPEDTVDETGATPARRWPSAPAVRAAGFRDKAFAELLGARYLWMRELGNLSVAEGTPEKGIRIENPAAANNLLENALGRPTRRVIFFCSCQIPRGCHRRHVAKLVVKCAKARGVGVTVVEWPGGEPRIVDIDVPVAAFRKIIRGTQKTFTFEPGMTAADAMALPWGTIARLRAEGDERMVLVGPAQFDAKGAHLKVLDVDAVSGSAKAYVEKNGYGVMKS